MALPRLLAPLVGLLVIASLLPAPGAAHHNQLLELTFDSDGNVSWTPDYRDGTPCPLPEPDPSDPSIIYTLCDAVCRDVAEVTLVGHGIGTFEAWTGCTADGPYPDDGQFIGARCSTLTLTDLTGTLSGLIPLVGNACEDQADMDSDEVGTPVCGIKVPVAADSWSVTCLLEISQFGDH